MKERPILFSGPMVRAILDGRKTQTRRVMKPQPLGYDPVFNGGVMEFCDDAEPDPRHFHKSLYGIPGDRLWVRETWAPVSDCAPMPGVNFIDPGTAALGCGAFYRANPGTLDSDVTGWKPSIFMPRWASRITLEITGVRWERLQGISESDALAEGIETASCPASTVYLAGRDVKGALARQTARAAYADLWDSIYGKREGAAWADNPWVWAVSFRRVEAPAT